MRKAPRRPEGEWENLPEDKLRGDGTPVAAQLHGQLGLLAPAVDLLKL